MTNRVGSGADGRAGIAAGRVHDQPLDLVPGGKPLIQADIHGASTGHRQNARFRKHVAQIMIDQLHRHIFVQFLDCGGVMQVRIVDQISHPARSQHVYQLLAEIMTLGPGLVAAQADRADHFCC